MKSISDILPLYGVEHDILLSKRGDLTIAYRLELPELFTLSVSDYETLHQSWLKLIRLLPDGCLLHKQDWFLEERFVGDFQETQGFLGRSSERHFNERPFIQQHSYLMLTMPANTSRKVNSLYSSLLQKRFVPAETMDPAFALSFESVCSQAVRLLADSGLIRCSRLQQDALVQLVNEYLSLDTDGLRRDLDFQDGVRVGENHCVLYTIGDTAALPSHCGPSIRFDPYSTDTSKFPIGFVSSFCQLLPVNHLYQQFIKIENQGELVERLEKKRLRLQSLSAYSRENAFARDAVNLFLQEAVADQRQIVSAHFNLLAWTEQESVLQALRNQCLTAMSTIDAFPKLETVGAPQLYWAGIPGNAADLPSNETFLSFANQAACFLNTETGAVTKGQGFGIRLGDRVSGRPLLVDISDGPMKQGLIANRNKVIISPSGGGKSFTLNHIARSYHEQGAHIVLIDIGHSYRGLCSMVNGTYFTYLDERPLCFNPFFLPAGVTADGEKKESIKTLILALWKKDDEHFTRSEYVALSNAVQGYYEKEIGFRCFDSFYTFLSNDYSIQMKAEVINPSDFDLNNLLFVLRPYYKGGEFDYLLNGQENLDLLHERFIVFELDTIKDHPILLPVVTIMIMDVFIAKMRQLKGERKMLVIEEAWKALMRTGMAEFIKFVYKTLRKYYGEAIVVTQEVEDILSSPIVKQTIIANSDCMILMDLSRYENKFQEVQSMLGLTEKERTMVLSLNKANDPDKKYKEVFISLAHRQSKVYRVEVSPEEYYCYTTEEKEKLMVTKAAHEWGGMEAGIQSMVAHLQK